MKYVIIGNSTAAVGAVEGIRQNDKDGKIVIISQEKYHVYSRPLISYLLLGKTTLQKMKYRGDGFYAHNKCELKAGVTALSVNHKEKLVTLSDGTCETYDRLLIATGSSPFVPPIDGLDKVKHKYTFTSLDNAIALEGAIRENSKVLIVGAGLIGLKCAEGLSRRNVEITCVDLAPRVLSSILDDEGAKVIQEHMEAHNVKFYLNEQVKGLEKGVAHLGSGGKIPVDVIVLAVGVRPNTSLIKDIGGRVNRGIIIDERCQTSIKDIYAAGDCCESIDAVTGETKVMALLPNAYMQGECAGRNMSGEDFVFDKAIPMNAMDLLGKHMITAGNYIGDCYFESDGENYKKLFYSDNRLNGYILIGNIGKAGIYTYLIREKTPLDTIDFELICKAPGLIAFGKAVRAEKLGGVKHEAVGS